MIPIRHSLRLAALGLVLGATACQANAPVSPAMPERGGAGGVGSSPAGTLGAAAQPDRNNQEVIVYTSVDQVFSEPVLKAFEAQTGIKAKAVYDVEAAKTTGLVNRILAEKPNPRADVWWNGEFAQTVELAQAGVLAPYRSPSAADIPPQYADKDYLWTGFGGRARVFLINTTRMKPEAYPTSIQALADSPDKADQVGMAQPVFGTAATQAAALYATWGEAKAKAYYSAIQTRGIRIVDGNSVVRDLVAQGELAWGITDTDDACEAIAKGAPVTLVFPDQAAGGLGTLVTPNTVGLVKGAPHAGAGKLFIDYLLSPAVTADLIKAGWFQVALRSIPNAPKSCVDTSNVKGMAIGLAETAAQIGVAKKDLAEIFVR